MLHQALLDVAAWCEKGIEPVPNTNYIFDDGQIILPWDADARGGLQPVVHSLANGSKCARVKVGEEVVFTADIQSPNGNAIITEAAWDFEKMDDFSQTVELSLREDKTEASVCARHCFEKPGTYFPVIKVKSSRTGTTQDIFVQCKNLDRVRVIVEE